MADDLDVLQGTLDVLVLKALSLGPRHGFAVGRWIRERSRDTIRVEDRALYVALHRLEARGLVDSTWGTSENNRRARYYELTAGGRRALRRKAAEWDAYAGAVGRVLRAEGGS
jgi:PadR family transcriptional regulator PadR